jgi:hypothetical protein
MCDNEYMEKQKLAEFTLGAVVLIFGVLIAINFANIDESNANTLTSIMFNKRQASAPLLRVDGGVKEGIYSKSEVAYPQFVRGPVDLNNAIKSAVDAALLREESMAESNWLARSSGLAGGDGKVTPPTSADKLLIRITWEPGEINMNRLTFLLRFSAATGGTRTLEEVKTFNYDVRSHRMLTIADIFPNNPNYLDQLSGFAYDSLKQQLSQRFNAKLGDAALKWLKAGTAPDEKNFKEFMLLYGNIKLYFGQNQVAAYDGGVPLVLYPL